MSDAEDALNGIKLINIYAKTNYPIVTAFEFEFLKKEEEVKALMKPCTIYFIVQRPLLYINNLVINDGFIEFEITDDSDNDPLSCTIDSTENGYFENGESANIEIGFYKKTPDESSPFNDVAAIKIFDEKMQFLHWYTPQKIIYEYLSGTLKLNMTGDIRQYIDYKVHYIGKAFSQDIWERLTGHEKLQSILTLEDPMSDKAVKNAFEISLIMLDVDGFDEIINFPYDKDLLPLGSKVTPILYEIHNEIDFSNFEQPNLDTRSEELTVEVESLLINRFKPEHYNKIKMKSYPNIRGGTREAGYTESTLVIERLPAILETQHYTQDVVLPK